MYKFVFVTGTGRCGTNLIPGLIDGHPNFDVVSGEYTNFFGATLVSNGLSSIIDLNHNGGTLLRAALELYENDPDFSEIKARVETTFKKITNEGNRQISCNEFLSKLCESLFQKQAGTAIINLCNENIAGLLEVFPESRVIHMIRNPLTQLNSRYLFRSGDVSNFGGSYPGHWEFGKTFRRNFDSFSQAAIFKKHKQVLVMRLEELQTDTKES